MSFTHDSYLFALSMNAFATRTPLLVTIQACINSCSNLYWALSQNLRDIDGCDPVLEVESIQGKKNRGNKTRYLVKWKGHVEMTWEPKSHLKDCKDMVQAFYDKANKAKNKLK